MNADDWPRSLRTAKRRGEFGTVFFVHTLPCPGQSDGDFVQVRRWCLFSSHETEVTPQLINFVHKHALFSSIVVDGWKNKKKKKVVVFMITCAVVFDAPRRMHQAVIVMLK